LLRALTPPAKVSPLQVSPLQPVPRKKRDYHESNVLAAAEPTPKTLFYSEVVLLFLRFILQVFLIQPSYHCPKSPSTSPQGKKKAPPAKKGMQFWPFFEE
jgi:hypothetical protein